MVLIFIDLEKENMLTEAEEIAQQWAIVEANVGSPFKEHVPWINLLINRVNDQAAGSRLDTESNLCSPGKGSEVSEWRKSVCVMVVRLAQLMILTLGGSILLEASLTRADNSRKREMNLRENLTAGTCDLYPCERGNAGPSAPR